MLTTEKSPTAELRKSSFGAKLCKALSRIAGYEPHDERSRTSNKLFVVCGPYFPKYDELNAANSFAPYLDRCTSYEATEAELKRVEEKLAKVTEVVHNRLEVLRGAVARAMEPEPEAKPAPKPAKSSVDEVKRCFTEAKGDWSRFMQLIDATRK